MLINILCTVFFCSVLLYLPVLYWTFKICIMFSWFSCKIKYNIFKKHVHRQDRYLGFNQRLLSSNAIQLLKLGFYSTARPRDYSGVQGIPNWYFVFWIWGFKKLVVLTNSVIYVVNQSIFFLKLISKFIQS